LPFHKGQPSCIIANTVKGKGLSFAENNFQYHYWKPTNEDMKKAIREMGVE